MTGKELKAWANGINDEAEIEVCHYNYGAWKKEFSMRAATDVRLEWKEEAHAKEPVRIDEEECRAVKPGVAQ